MKVALALLLALVAGCKDSPPRKRRPRPDAEAYQPPPRFDAEPEARECDPAQRTACVEDKVVACLRDGWFGVEIETCEHGCWRGACAKPCEVQGVELIYVIDDDQRLLSFDPRKLPADPFQLVAPLTCDLSSGAFSMAVDRLGIAWVVYKNRTVHRVSIADGRCFPGAFVAASTFGMGFVTDGPGRETEKLFVANKGALAEMDLSVLPPPRQELGMIVAARDADGRVELTGTGEGELFAYMPKPGLGFVQQIDRDTAEALGPRWSLGGEGDVGSFAFAHWGGVFYVFMGSDTGATSVYAVHRATGKSELVWRDLRPGILGAGVSTCAPALEAPL